MNSKHVLITTLACVVAAILFFITMLAAPAPKPQTTTGGSPLVALPGGLGEDDPSMQQLEIHFTDDHGVAYDLFGDSLTPKSQGIIDVTKPIARIHLKPNRSVIQIEADQGTFVTPTTEDRSGMIGSVGQPQSGFLKGNVKIRLFEGDGHHPLELEPNSADQVLVMTMQQANFDRDLGQIEADGLVQLDGRDAAFEGTNLNIIYSPLLKRINRLEIQHGKFIRIKHTNMNNPQHPQDTPDAATTTTDATQTKADENPAQFYHITLNNNIKIQAQNNTLTGNKLQLYVGFTGAKRNQTQQDKQPESAPALTATPSSPKVAADDPQDDVLITWTGSLLMLPEDDKPAMLADAHDAYLQLDGTPMQITPPSKDIITASSIDYLLSQSRLRIRSNDTFPLLIDSPQLGGIITAQNYEMYLDKGLGILQGEGELRGLTHSVSVEARDDTTPTIPVDNKRLTPGTSIRWRDRVELVFYPRLVEQPKPQTPEKIKSSDESSAAASTDHQPEDESATSSTEPIVKQPVPVQIAHGRADFNALQTITFRGKVNVQHDQFDVQSDIVTVHMTRPTADDRKQHANVIEAAGKVAIRTHSTDPEMQLALHADKAKINFTEDKKGRMQPTQLLADDNVVIRRPDQVLWADKLTVDLGIGKPAPVALAPQATEKKTDKPKPVDALDTMLAWEDKKKPVPTVTPVEGAQPAKPLDDARQDKPEADKLYVKLVTVEGDVRARLINSGQMVFAFAHRITGDEHQVELFGNDDRPAQVVQDQGILAGDHLVLTPKDQNLHVIGKGSLSYLSHPLDAKPADAQIKPLITKPTAGTDTQSVSVLNVDGSGQSVPPDNNTATNDNAKPPAPDSTTVINDNLDQPAPDLPSLEPAKVHVRWLDNMHYNHQTRQAQFLGHVILTAKRTNAATTVKGDDITVLFNKFIRPEQPKRSSLEDATAPRFNQDGTVSSQSLKGGRQVRMVDIKGHAEFLEETWSPPGSSPGSSPTKTNDKGDRKTANAKPQRTLLTRLRLAGEDMVFDAVPETITIPGPGTLLHEDHRPRPSKSQAKGEASMGNVQFTGRGQTLFRWKDEFLLDIAHNDMIMKDYVQMLHIPADSDNGIQLDCRTFIADMQATGGLGTWLSANPPTPDLKVVQASRDVRITAQNRQITTDRATYIHDVHKVKLQADPNHLTRITTPSGTSAPGAQLIIWELDINRFYIARPGRMNEVAPRR